MVNKTKEFEASCSNSNESNSGLKKAMHGYMFQLKILMLFFIRGLENGYSFNLMTEWDPAGKFDDLGFVYDNKNRIGKIYRLLQAKHSWSDNKEISENDLFMEKNDFSIQKYFISYQETIKNEQFTKPNIEIKDFIIFTNRNPEQILRDQLQEITDEDKILDNKKYHKNSKRYKIGTGKLKDKIVPILKNLSDLHKLLKILAAGKTLDFKNDRLLQSYRNVLEREVLHIDNNVHRPDPHTVKFSRCFLDGSSEELIKIKNIFYQHWKPNEKFNEQQLEEWEAQTFNFLKKDFKKIQYDFIKEFAAEIGEAKNKARNIVNITIKKDISQSCIDKIKEMMIRNENAENLFSFRSEFFKQKKLSNEILNKFRNELTEELRRLKMEFTEIEYYQFHIIDFLNNEKLNLPQDDVTDEEINDFLSKLIFAVNQPNEGELDKIIESEIADNDDMTSISEFSTNNFQKYMHDWLKAKESNFLNDNDAKIVFKEIRSKMAKIMLSSNSLHCIKLLENMNITFTDDAANELNLKSFLESTVKDQIVFNIISDEIELSSAKVYQILKNFYTNKNDYNFLKFSSIDLLRKYVLQTFDSQNNNCLVILYKKEDVTKNIILRKFLNEIEITIIEYNKTVDEANNTKDEEKRIKYPNKKIILIANDNNSANSGYKIHKDIKLDFVDLSSESQKKIMKRNVKFQGKKIRLGSLILNEKLTHSLNSVMLSDLIKNEEIKIGKELIDLGEIKDYYIHRPFTRQVQLIKNFKNETKKFFTVEILKPNFGKGFVFSPTNIADNLTDVFDCTYVGNDIFLLQVKQGEFYWHQSNAILKQTSNSNEIVDIINESFQNEMSQFYIIEVTKTNIHENIILITDHIDDNYFNELCNDIKSGSIYWFKKRKSNLLLWMFHDSIPKLYNFEAAKKFINENFNKESAAFLIIEYTAFIPQQDVVLITDDNNNNNHFNYLCEKYENYNIHWIVKDQNNYEWHHSRGSLEKLQDFVNRNSEANVNVETITDICDKVVIIVAEPGMGKSTVLTYLAATTKESFAVLWIVRINLIDYSKKLSDYEFEDLKTYAKEFICSCAVNGDSLFEKDLFYSFYNQNKMILLFDGFDEINPYYKEKVIVLLKTLKSIEKGKIWITTRPYGIQNELENELSVFSYSLQPILKDDQVNFLKKYWKQILKLRDLGTHSDVFIDELLKKFSQSTNDKGGKFVQIPLQIRMIADVFQEMFNEFYSSDSDSLSNKLKQKLHEKLNLVNLYESFIQIKFDKIFIKNTHMDDNISSVKTIIEKERKDFIEKHKKLALFGIFGEEAQNLFKDLTDKEIADLYRNFGENGIKLLELNDVDSIQDILFCNEKTGIIDRIIDNKPIFVHKSFAEYFVALWLAGNWQKQERVKRFLCEHISNDENKVIRNFFDYLMIKVEIEDYYKNENIIGKKFEIHNAVLNRDNIKIIELLTESENIEEIFNSVDKGGRKAIHLALDYQFEDIVDILLDPNHIKLIKNIDSNDKIFDQNLLNYAEKWENWRVVELLLKAGANGSRMRFESLIFVNKYDNIINYEQRLLKSFIDKKYVKLPEVLIRKRLDIFVEDLNDLTAFCYAASAGILDLVKYFVEKGFNVNGNTNDSKESIISCAVRSSNLEVVKYLIKEGVDINQVLKHFTNDSPVVIAADNGYSDIIEYFIEEHGKILGNISKGQNILHYAAQCDQVKVITCFINYLEKNKPYDIFNFINHVDVYGVTPLQSAVDSRKTRNVTFLINYIENTNSDGLMKILTHKNKSGMSLLHSAASSENIETVELIISKFLDKQFKDLNLWDFITAKATDGSTPLHCASHKGHTIIVKYFIKLLEKYYPDKIRDFINIDNNDNSTPIHFAIENNKLETVKYLMNKNADIFKINQEMESVLHLVVESRNVEILKLVLNKIKNSKWNSLPFIDFKNSDGNSALMKAVQKKEVKMVEILLETGSDPNIQNKYQETALHLSVKYWNRSIEIVKLLLKEKSDRNIQNKDGQTPLKLAKQIIIKVTNVAETKYLNDIINLLAAEVEPLVWLQNHTLATK